MHTQGSILLRFTSQYRYMRKPTPLVLTIRGFAGPSGQIESNQDGSQISSVGVPSEPLLKIDVYQAGWGS